MSQFYCSTVLARAFSASADVQARLAGAEVGFIRLQISIVRGTEC